MMKQLYSILICISILGPLTVLGQITISRGDYSVYRIDNAPAKVRSIGTDGSIDARVQQNTIANGSRLKRQSLTRPGSTPNLLNKALSGSASSCESNDVQQSPFTVRQHFVRLPDAINIDTAIFNQDIQRPSPDQPSQQRIPISISSGNLRIPISSGLEPNYVMGPVQSGDGMGRATSGDGMGRAASVDGMGRAASGDGMGRAASGDGMGRAVSTVNDKNRKVLADNLTPFVLTRNGKKKGKPVQDDNDNDDEVNAPIAMKPREWRCMDSSGSSPGSQTLVCPPGMVITGYGLVSAGNPQGSCEPDSKRLPGSCHLDLISSLDTSGCSGKATCTIDTISEKRFSEHCSRSFNASTARILAEFECSPWRSSPEPKASSTSKCQQIRDNGTLFCPEDEVIIGFGFAFFGELDGSCSAGIEPGLCSRNVLTDLTGRCSGKNSCPVEASVKSLGSPCANNSTTPLTLATNFRCGPASEFMANSSGFAPRQGYSTNGTLNLQPFKNGNTAHCNSYALGASLAILSAFAFMV